MSSKRILVVATAGWFLCALAFSCLTFRHYAGKHEQGEAAIGAFIAGITPLILVLMLLGLWRMVRMRFPH